MGGALTLIIVRITLTEAKAAFAGVPSITSFMIFRTSIAAFNEERAASRRSGFWGFGSMVEVDVRNLRGTRWGEGPDRDGDRKGDRSADPP